MKPSSPFKSGIITGFSFFLTVTILSIGYAAFSSGLSLSDKVGTGSGLSSSSWNKIIDSLLELDGRTSGITSSGGNIGIGASSPTTKLDVAGSVKFDGVNELNWAGWASGNQNVSVTFTHSSNSSMEITAVFNHYGYISSYGAARKSLVANGPGTMDVVDITNVNSTTGGSWTYTRNSDSSITITKTAGTYIGAGYYFITARGNYNLSK